ncbi:unnamed protein product [Ostreobium quekettii]|uniref:NB-ARC domain-containing protein n=1 Tax=Ostreobium quekettii TaxID=121088 RepID=A0A8S1J5Q8_9CHLO|nr:unnamed protein product [Ostreobium quekettii]
MATSSGALVEDSEEVSPTALGRLLAADVGQVQTWKTSGWKSGKWEFVFLLRRVDLWWIFTQPGKPCPTDAGAWRKGNHIALVRGQTVVDFSDKEAGEWFVKFGDDCHYFKARSTGEAALWVMALRRRVHPWNDELQGQTAGELVGDAGHHDKVMGPISLSHSTAAQEMVKALGAVAGFTKEVLGTLPIAGPALSLLGFAMEAVCEGAADAENIRPARALLEEVANWTMEVLRRASKLHDEDYKQEIFKVLDGIESAARMLERHRYRSTAGKLKNTFLKRGTGSLAIVDLLKQCKDDLSKLQIHQLEKLQIAGLEEQDKQHAVVVANQQRLLCQASIRRRKHCSPSNIPTAPDAVALESQLYVVRNMLLESETKCIVIWGMGGIGKTTLARALLNDPEIATNFEKREFVTVSQHPNVTKCQQQVWDALVDSEQGVQFTNAEDGKLRLQTALKDEVVFIVLDDMWDENIVPHFDVVSAKSRVVITSRNSGIATSVGARRYAAAALGEDDSMQLFCKKAFATGQPLGWQALYVKDIVKECGGLPLALEVMGAEVKGYSSGEQVKLGPTPREKRKWERAVERIKTSGVVAGGLFDKVFAMSFDSLDNPHQVALLDLAMLPEDHEARESDVAEMQCCNGLSTDEAYEVLEELEQRSLIIRTGEDALSVCEFQTRGFATCHLHDVVRDSALRLMTNQPFVESCRLVSHHLKKELPFKDQGLLATKFSKTHSIGQDSDLDLCALNMPNLRALVLRNAELLGVPVNLLSASLVVIDLAFSGVAVLPSEVACATSARVLRLDGCDRLEHLPCEVGAMQQLQVLSMRGCQGIYELPESLARLSNLRKLLMPTCGIAHFLSMELGSLQSLKMLDLSGCFGLKHLPPSLGELAGLTALDLDSCWQLSSLPSTIGKLARLEVLLLHGCTSLEELPSAMTLLHNLAELDVQGCHRLKCLPQGFAYGCPGLKILRLQENSQFVLPDFVLELQHLEVLGVDRVCMLPGSMAQDLNGQRVSLEQQPTEDYESKHHMERDTPLHWAAGMGMLGMVEYHLTETSVDAPNLFGDTPLLKAAENGRTATVKLLLDRGASIDEADQFGNMPLLRAAENGYTGTVELFLNRGAAVEAADGFGKTPLFRAAQHGHTATVKLLLNRGASVDAADRSGHTPLISSACYGHTATVELLLNRGATVDAASRSGYTALIRAAESGHAATVELLLNRGASVGVADHSGYTPLLWSACYGHTATVELLLNRGASVDAASHEAFTPLLLAAVNGHAATVKLLLNRGASVVVADRDGNTPLIWSAFYGHTATVKVLLNQGAAVDAANQFGYTPLLRAAENGHAVAVELLLNRGAPIDAANQVR